MQRLTGAELLNKVREEKMSLNDEDSYFDDMITLYIGKGVGAYKSDEKIIGPLLKLDEEITTLLINLLRAILGSSIPWFSRALFSFPL